MHSHLRTAIPVLFVIGCLPHADKDTGAESGSVLSGLSASLAGMDFLLESTEGFDPVEGTTGRLGFDEDAGGGLSFSLSAGCNHLGGSFTLEDDHMRVSEMGMTEMGCDMALMDQDSWFATFFSGGPHLSMTDDVLTVTGADAALIFVDREVAEPDRSLTGQIWTIDSFIDGDAVSALNLTTDPTISFSDAGEMTIASGCNDGWGSYSVDGNTLTFTGVSFTEMECSDESTADAERHVAGVVMDGSATYTIDAARLTIERGTTGISAWTD